MRIVSVCTLSVVGLCGFAQPQESFHKISFNPPQGWNATATSETLLYSDVQQDKFCILSVYPAISVIGTQSQDFHEEWLTKVQAISAHANSPRQSIASTASGIPFVEGGAQIVLKDNQGHMYAHLVVLFIGSMRQSILVGFSTQSVMADYHQVLSSFFGSMVVAAEPSKPDPATAIKTTTSMADSNNGTFYYGIETEFMGVTAGNNPKYLYLLPNNTFQWGYYQRGYYMYDHAKELKLDDEFCGSYTRHGNQIILSFPGNPDYKPEFSFDETGNLKSVSKSYTMYRFANLNGKRLVGKYSVEDNGLPWPGGKPTAQFFGNGRFEDAGLLCMGERVDSSLPYEAAEKHMKDNKVPGAGSYTIIDNSLLLHYDDGRVRQLLIYIYEKEVMKDSPEMVMIADSPIFLSR